MMNSDRRLARRFVQGQCEMTPVRSMPCGMADMQGWCARPPMLAPPFSGPRSQRDRAIRPTSNVRFCPRAPFASRRNSMEDAHTMVDTESFGLPECAFLAVRYAPAAIYFLSLARAASVSRRATER